VGKEKVIQEVISKFENVTSILARKTFTLGSYCSVMLS